MGLDGYHTQLQRRWATRHTLHVTLAYMNVLHSDCHPATCMHVLSIRSRLDDDHSRHRQWILKHLCAFCHGKVTSCQPRLRFAPIRQGVQTLQMA
jgi:hypothetical protein